MILTNFVGQLLTQTLTVCAMKISGMEMSLWTRKTVAQKYPTDLLKEIVLLSSNKTFYLAYCMTIKFPEKCYGVGLVKRLPISSVLNLKQLI